MLYIEEEATDEKSDMKTDLQGFNTWDIFILMYNFFKCFDFFCNLILT